MIFPQLGLLAIILLSLVALLTLRRQHPSTDAHTTSSDDFSLSPLQLSYLMDGQEGLARALLSSLTRKGWIVQRTDLHISGTTSYFLPAHTPPPPSLLNAAERELWLALCALPSPPSREELVATGGMAEVLAMFGTHHHRDLARLHLLHSPERCEAHDTSRYTWSHIILALGTITGLLFLGTSIAGGVCVFALTVAARQLILHLTAHPRRTPAGDALLETYKTLYEPMYLRRETWRRIDPLDFDTMHVIFSRT